LVEHSLGKGEVIGSIPIISSRDLQLEIASLVNAHRTEPGSRVPFQQAGIGVEKQEEFKQLHSALERIFAADAVGKYLRLLQSKGVPIRDFDRVLREKLLERADHGLGKSGRGARQWYDALSVGDQAQVREFYLTALEAVDLPLREKFKQLYRYY
jgi:hypothetical protein